MTKPTVAVVVGVIEVKEVGDGDGDEDEDGAHDRKSLTGG